MFFVCGLCACLASPSSVAFFCLNMEIEVILGQSRICKSGFLVLCFALHTDAWLKLAPVQPFRVQVATLFINHTKQGKCANVW